MLVIIESDTADIDVRRAPDPSPIAARAADAPSPPVPGLLARRLPLSVVLLVGVIGGGGCMR